MPDSWLPPFPWQHSQSTLIFKNTILNTKSHLLHLFSMCVHWLLSCSVASFSILILKKLILNADYEEHLFRCAPTDSPLSLARSEWLLLAGAGKSPLRARTLLRCFIFYILFYLGFAFFVSLDRQVVVCVRIILIRQLSGENAREDFFIVGKTPTRRGRVRAIFSSLLC